jgi:proteasome lid subunit RPN8/RPN11
MDEHWELDGTALKESSQAIPRAQALASFLAKDSHPYARLVEIRTHGEALETVIFDVEIEVSQTRKNDIRPSERIAATFAPADDAPPDVLALRKDFPHVPHISPRPTEFPRGLCLYDEPYREIKLRWTPAAFIERIRTWLRDTADGSLHRGDQPLEPVFLGNYPPLILPAGFITDLFTGHEVTLAAIQVREPRPGQQVLLAAVGELAQPSWIAIGLATPPQTHGIIRSLPANLQQLHEQLLPTGYDLFAALTPILQAWYRDDKLRDRYLKARLIILLALPKTRTPGGPVEHVEPWALLSMDPIGTVGTQLGAWERTNGFMGLVLGSPQPNDANLAQLQPLIVMERLSQETAARLNDTNPETCKITAIGMGSVGSQILMNLVRAGFGHWKVIDNDYLLPHNAARHHLTASGAGLAKVHLMQREANLVTDDQVVEEALVIDVLHPGDNAPLLEAALASADLLLDCSASLAVARHVAHAKSTARRISVFLNATGTDLVLLAEDRARTIPLDAVEMQYYRAVAQTPELQAHFAHPETAIRFARACRDVTNRIPQDYIVVLAGLASNALRKIVHNAGAIITVWHITPDTEVHVHTFEAQGTQQVKLDGWRMHIDQQTLRRIAAQRAEKLPKETGGVLVGTMDLLHRVAYIVDTIPAPYDSTECPAAFIRGCEGLPEELRALGARTDQQLHYLGEWHSHPNGYDARPSDDDQNLFGWLQEHLAAEGIPPIMLIAGQEHAWCCIETITNHGVITYADAEGATT